MILIVTKYTQFILTNLPFIAQDTTDNIVSLILIPVGISYYTFQVCGYLSDVKNGEKAEKNFLKYALYVSYFPKMVSGPIECYKDFRIEIEKLEKYKLSKVQQKVLFILYGFFMKMVLADRCSIFVNEVFVNFSLYGASELILAAFLFGIQIYCDFEGYMYIARGVSGFWGIELMRNFEQPYLATSIKEFWRRWHISLTKWLTRYIYIPLGGNRRGKINQYINIMIVFLVSGIWHGANWNFIIWGLLHGVFQVIGNMRTLLHGKFNGDVTYESSTKIRKCVITFILVDFAWIFFKADSLEHAWQFIKTMFIKLISFDFMRQPLVGIGGMRYADWCVLLIAIGIVLAVDLLHERKICICDMIEVQELWFQGLILTFFCLFTILFGVYGVGYNVGEFIYSRF